MTDDQKDVGERIIRGVVHGRFSKTGISEVEVRPDFVFDGDAVIRVIGVLRTTTHTELSPKSR